MKEATGEGSMTIVTIVIIAAIVVAGGVVISFMMSNARTTAEEVATDTPEICTNPDENGNCPE